ncbi:hypothetical protein Efla_000415 [Eimeria flavescens]
MPAATGRQNAKNRRASGVHRSATSSFLKLSSAFPATPEAPEAKRTAAANRASKILRSGGRGDKKTVQEPLIEQCRHISVGAGCHHPRRMSTSASLASRSDPQPSALVNHPHRAWWLAAVGRTPESMFLTHIVGKDYFREPDKKLVRVVPGAFEDEALAMLRMDHPFDANLLFKLAVASPARLRQFLDKLAYVQREVVTAIKKGNNLHRTALQQILETTADIAGYLLDEEAKLDETETSERTTLSDQMEFSFQMRVATVLLDFNSGKLDENPQVDPSKSCSHAALNLLQRQAKCIKIFLLFHQIEPKHLWTRAAIRSLAAQLWRRRIEQISARFATLAPLYDLALVYARLPARASTSLVARIPEEVRAYSYLFKWSAPDA